MPAPSEFYVLLVNGTVAFGNFDRALVEEQAQSWLRSGTAADGTPVVCTIRRYVLAEEE